ncbi:gp53-like domain-containing protein [Acidaminococcus fermentans]|uniref:gp53-like domain-containing protein n=1 Tax=Acidaminococcus fermentans TaxID=905 RepID=UPI0024303FA6|nr:hypothetical protein [Acidaminococcus fermentans]
MSIKKCIMNYFDKATNAMVPFHPQTESGAITDWHESIIGSLASKVLPTVVSELTTDSVMGKLMKMLLTASGVKYSIDTNGYVCLGSFFGGLIIQWGIASLRNSDGGWVNFPLTFPKAAYILECTHYNSLESAINVYLETSYLATDKAYVRSDKDSTQVHFLAVGH